MSLKKAINSGKEKRQKYRGPKRFDRSCRNHGSCNYCKDNRIYFDKRNRYSAEKAIDEYLNPKYLDNYEDFHIEIEKTIEGLNEFFMSEDNKKPDIQKFFDNCPTTAKITYIRGEYNSTDEEEVEKNNPCFVIEWSEEGRGFGEYCFFIKNGKWMIYNECDSKENIKKILGVLVDSLELMDK
jgi:hypothetical protein